MSAETLVHVGIPSLSLHFWEVHVWFEAKARLYHWSVDRPVGHADEIQIFGTGTSRSADLAFQEAKLAWWDAGRQEVPPET
jgi:hypothetical protein